jgi:hypothetical protein
MAELFNEQRLAGAVLALAFILFAIGATLPLLGRNGNTRIFMLPDPEYLRAIAHNPVAWRWANILMGAAALVLLTGLQMLTTILEGVNERTLSRLGLVGFLVAAVLWVIFSAFRATTTITAAREMVAKGEVPPYYEPMGQWAGGLFKVYAVVGFLTPAAYGGSLLQTALVPGWAAWVTIIFSLAMLVLLLIQGDTLPAYHYLPGLLVGVILIVQG